MTPAATPGGTVAKKAKKAAKAAKTKKTAKKKGTGFC
jgi:hypothetical protein